MQKHLSQIVCSERAYHVDDSGSEFDVFSVKFTLSQSLQKHLILGRNRRSKSIKGISLNIYKFGVAVQGI